MVRRLVPLSTGGEAVLVISGVEPGEPSAVSQAQRDQRQRELADQAGQIEMNAYAGNVRDKASVSVPDAILNPQF